MRFNIFLAHTNSYDLNRHIAMETCKPLLQRLIGSTLFLISCSLFGPAYSSCMSEAEKLQLKQEISQSTGLSQKALESFLETEDPNLSRTGAWFNHFHAAVMYRHSTIIPLMIKCGADVNKEDGAGRTPLKVALSQRDLDTLTALLSGKPALEMSFYRNSRFDNDLLFYAISHIKTEQDLHLLEALISAGMKVTNADLKRVLDEERVKEKDFLYSYLLSMQDNRNLSAQDDSDGGAPLHN